MNYKTYYIQRYTTTKNPIGEEIKSWEDVGSVEGHLYQLSGKEQYQSNKDTRIIKWRFHGNMPELTETTNEIFFISTTQSVSVDTTNDIEVTEEFRLRDGSTYYDIELINVLNKLGFEKVEIDLKLVR